MIGLIVVSREWEAYEQGLTFPNLTRMQGAADNKQAITTMQKDLNTAKERLEKIKPYLLMWADRPAPKAPPSERVPDDGRPKIA